LPICYISISCNVCNFGIIWTCAWIVRDSIMKHFEWRWVKRFGDTDAQLSLLEVDDGFAIFWATLKPISEDKNELFWTPIMINKDRNGYISIHEILFLDELKECVEKKLMEEGIIPDGCELEDYTI
jgi:hypothetical protein